MPACEVYITYQNHQICVVRTNWETARLYVDDELLDINSDLYASGVGPALMGIFAVTLTSTRSICTLIPSAFSITARATASFISPCKCTRFKVFHTAHPVSALTGVVA